MNCAMCKMEFYFNLHFEMKDKRRHTRARVDSEKSFQSFSFDQTEAFSLSLYKDLKIDLSLLVREMQ